MEVDEHSSQEESAVEHTKNIRRRKKHLYKSILEQMEFYFSDANVKKDRFIGQLIQQDPYVDLEVFLKFNKIASLTNKIDEICTALEKSEFLKLSEDKKKVCRKTPIVEKTNEDECTIYVERLPEDATHDWLIEIFSSFGKVDYVSLPKYKHNKRHKGFAFIEFKQVESVQKALTYFESIGCKLTMDMSPNQLASIITFENTGQCPQENQKHFQSDNFTEKNVTKKNKRKFENEDLVDCKKMKIEAIEQKLEEDDENKGNAELKHEEKDIKEEKESDIEKNDAKVDQSKENEGEMIVDNQEGEAKKKRKRKKHRKGKDDLKQLGLQVLSKKEWKQLRNKYLNLQRIKMKTLKEHLYRHRHYNRQVPDTTGDKNESKTGQETNNSEQKSQQRFKYSPDCIIQFSIPEGFTDIKKLKTDIRSNPGVEFIDVQPGKELGFIRFSDSKMSKDFLDSNFFDTSKLLKGQEESSYWEKIMKDRDTKFNKNNQPVKKVRGREKLLKKAEHELGKHIRFEN